MRANGNPPQQPVPDFLDYDDRDATGHLRRDYRKPWKHPGGEK